MPAVPWQSDEPLSSRCAPGAPRELGAGDEELLVEVVGRRCDHSRCPVAPLDADDSRPVLRAPRSSKAASLRGRFSTTAVRASTAFDVRCRAARRRESRPRPSARTFPTRPCTGPRHAIRVPVQLLRPQAVGVAAREKRCRALVPGLAPSQLLCPVEHATRGDERSGRAPHDLVGLVVDVLADASVERVGEVGLGASRNAASRIPASPLGAPTRARLGKVRPSPGGRASRTRAARARAARGRPRSSLVSAWPALAQVGERPQDARSAAIQRPSAGSSHASDPSAPHGQRSFGPRSAASVSSTISRMPARIRSSSQGSSVSGSKSSGR